MDTKLKESANKINKGLDTVHNYIIKYGLELDDDYIFMYKAKLENILEEIKLLEEK